MLSQMLSSDEFYSKVEGVTDNNGIHSAYVSNQADVAIIEALWVVPSKFDELYEADPKAKFVVRLHSQTPFLAQEGIGFDWILQYLQKPNVTVAANSQHMFEDVRWLARIQNPTWTDEQLDSKVVYLPNYYEFESPTSGVQFKKSLVTKVDSMEALTTDSNEVHVGCFGALRLLKNHMEQALGALKFATAIGKNLRFHINGSMNDVNVDPILKSLYTLFQRLGTQHQLVMHDWMPHEEFLALVFTMDVVSQVSFTETFNIVAADAASQNVALVTSKEIPWAATCFFADPTDSNSIAAILERAYKMKQRFKNFNSNLRGLKAFNSMTKTRWVAYLDTI
jgi:hypothetical protein